jgi:ribosome maturation factor RimP
MPLDEAHVREIAERVAAFSGLEIVDVEFHGGGKGRVLRIFIEKNAEGRRALEQQLAAAEPAAVAAGGLGRLVANSDQLSGVTHEDCANYSRELGTILDVEDAIPGGEYLLEVSSPGLDRKLVKPADFQRFMGSRVKVMTRDPVAGNRHWEGRLKTAEDGRIVLALGAVKKKAKKKRPAEGNGADKVIELEMSNIERARLVPEI